VTAHGGDQTYKVSGSPDLSNFRVDLLSDADSAYLRETLFEIFGTPEKTCLICTGVPVKTCWKFWHSQLFQVRSLPSVVMQRSLLS